MTISPLKNCAHVVAVAMALTLLAGIASAQATTTPGTANQCNGTATPTFIGTGTLTQFNIERRLTPTSFDASTGTSFPSGVLQSVAGGALEFRETLVYNPQNGRLTSRLFTQQPSSTFPTPIQTLTTLSATDLLSTYSICVDRIYRSSNPRPNVMFVGTVIENLVSGPFGTLNGAPAAVSVSYPTATGTGGTGGGGTGTVDTTTEIANVVVLIAGNVTAFTSTASGTVTITGVPTTPGGGGNGGTGTGPTANAGAAQQQAFTRTHVLNATASTAGTAGGPLTYLWRIPQGARSATILNPTSAQPQIIFGEGFGDYDVELVVTDPAGNVSEPARITITYLGSNPF